jgi:hypothetical protein
MPECILRKVQIDPPSTGRHRIVPSAFDARRARTLNRRSSDCTLHRVFVNFSVMPLWISTINGFVLSGIGAFGCAMVVGEALLYSPPAGWASLMAAVLLLSGVQLLILGIVGEYLGRLYLTANRKPQSVVKEVRRIKPSLSAEGLPPVWLRERALEHWPPIIPAS